MSSNSLHIGDAPRNITPTMAKPLATLNLKQKLQRLGKSEELKENYPEKEADQKMKSSKRNIFSRYCTYIYFIKLIMFISYILVTHNFNMSFIPAMQSSKDIINKVMYISFVPVFILYLCYSWKKVNVYTIFP